MSVLHDRRIPGSRGNIDHIVVAPWGVFVIDAKNYEGRVEKRDHGGVFSTDYRLYVGGRDKTPRVAGMAKQVEAVRAALGDEFASVQICKAICFVAADWSLFARPIEMDRVQVLWPRVRPADSASWGPAATRQARPRAADLWEAAWTGDLRCYEGLDPGSKEQA
jgi:hypothetical protein